MSKIKIMKKTIFLLAFSAIATLGFSQSKFFVGGNFSLGTKSGETTSSGLVINATTKLPSITKLGIDVESAYFISDKLAVGLGLGFKSYKSVEELKYESPYPVQETYIRTTTSTKSKFTIAPMVYYFSPITDKFVWAPSLAIPVGFGGTFDEEKIVSTQPNNNNTSPEPEENDLSSFGVVISPLSFDYHITDNIAINFSAGDLSFISEKKSNELNNTKTEESKSFFNLSLNPSIKLGFRLYF
jgi:hypothetical protein